MFLQQIILQNVKVFFLSNIFIENFLHNNFFTYFSALLQNITNAKLLAYMKKTLLTAILAFAGFAAQAQLADGSIAPDFTATDINGNPHTLSSYLALGKTVIIDISATWCGPCWNYHGTNALSDIYETYGVGGSGEVVVLFIEGDPYTSVESISGTNTSTDTKATQGDWTQHSPYPIIDDTTGSISEAYAVEYFPTIYMICPTGVVTELTQPTATALKTKITNTCGATLTGVQNKARPDASSVIYCEADGAYSAKIKNLGANKIYNATVVLKENGTVLATKTYTSTNGLSTLGTANIAFDSVTFTEGTEHTVEITSFNDLTTLPYPELAVEEVSITPNNAEEIANNLTVSIYTDFYPKEASWEIRSVDGNAVVASGGPYAAGPAEYGGGGADANTVKTKQVNLPEGIECYKVILKDTFGDGWIYGSDANVNTNEFHGIRLYNSGTMVYEQSVSTFTFSAITYDAALITNGTMGVKQPQTLSAVNVYPNPSSGIINISTTESVDISIADLTGKIVYRANGIQDGGTVNLTSLQQGMYLATLKGASGEKTEKIIIK